MGWSALLLLALAVALSITAYMIGRNIDVASASKALLLYGAGLLSLGAAAACGFVWLVS